MKNSTKWLPWLLLTIVTMVTITIVTIIYIVYKINYHKDTFSRLDPSEFHNKELFSRRPRVVVSFSTIPSRVKYITEVISKLETQSFQPDMIYACVPYYSKRLKRKYEIPPDIKLGENAKIVRGNDYGPATKLLGSIPYENNPNTIIITIDDDQDYHEDTLRILVAYSIHYPNKVFSFNALKDNLNPSACPLFKNIKSPSAFYAEGFGGVLYKRSFVTNEMMYYFKNLSSDCFVSDDLTISSWMEINHIERVRLCDIILNRNTDKNIDSHDPLHADKRKQVYNNCSKEMKVLIYRKDSEKIMKAFHYVMDKNKIPYVAAFGTLLGVIRDKNFIDSDHDLDVIILEPYLEKYLTLQKDFKSVGLKMNYGDYIHRIDLNVKNPHSYMDVFVFKKDGNKFVDIVKFNRERWPRAYIYENELFPIRRYKIGNLDVLGPNSPEILMKRNYGDWKTPRGNDDYVV